MLLGDNMSNETTNVGDIESGETKQVETSKSNVDIKAFEDNIKSMQDKISKLTEMNETLFKERKADQDKRKQAEEDVLRKKGDYEQLLKSAEERNKDWENKWREKEEAQGREKVNTTALRLAGSIAEGDNIELLSEQIAKRLKHTDDGIKVIGRDGQLSVTPVDSLKEEFINDKRYASLITRTKASGGGATGSNSSGAQTKEMKRSDFMALNPTQQMEYSLKSDFKLID